MEKTWLELANRTGLTYKLGHLLDFSILKGEFKGWPIELQIHPIGACDIGSPFIKTRIIVKFRETVEGYFTINRRNLFNRAKLQTGDEQFDKMYSIECYPRNMLEMILGSTSHRNRLYQSNISHLGIYKGELTINIDGVMDDVNYLCEILDLACDLAETVVEI
jgi:hypothetical protein